MEVKHTPLPWKMVSAPNFDNGNVYTSIQPVNVDEETMKPLAMVGGEYHVCRMSHTAAEWRFSYHRENATFIVRACNSHYALLESAKSTTAALVAAVSLLERGSKKAAPSDKMFDTMIADYENAIEAARAAIAKAEGRS